MSYSFEVGTYTVWSPALRVGETYMAYVHGLEAVYGKSAGIRALSEDMVEIDPDVFRGFVQNLVAVLASGNHAILELELRAVIIPAVVMLERAGVVLAWSDHSDLINEAHSLARAMPD
jgi:Family of unknown function (DUF6086)